MSDYDGIKDKVKQPGLDDTQVLKLLPKDAEAEGDEDEEGGEDDEGVFVYTVSLRHSSPVVAFDPRSPVDLLPAFMASRVLAAAGGDPYFIFEGDVEDGTGAAVVNIADVAAVQPFLTDEDLAEYLAPDDDEDEDEDDDVEETPGERVAREKLERAERKRAERQARREAEEAAAAKKGKGRGLKGLVTE